MARSAPDRRRYSDEGAKIEKSAFDSFYGGLFILIDIVFDRVFYCFFSRILFCTSADNLQTGRE